MTTTNDPQLRSDVQDAIDTYNQQHTYSIERLRADWPDVPEPLRQAALTARDADLWTERNDYFCFGCDAQWPTNGPPPGMNDPHDDCDMPYWVQD